MRQSNAEKIERLRNRKFDSEPPTKCRHPHGVAHVQTLDNISVDKDGGISCLPCQRITTNKRNRKKKEEETKAARQQAAGGRLARDVAKDAFNEPRPINGTSLARDVLQKPPRPQTFSDMVPAPPKPEPKPIKPTHLVRLRSISIIEKVGYVEVEGTSTDEEAGIAAIQKVTNGGALEYYKKATTVERKMPTYEVVDVVDL